MARHPTKVTWREDFSLVDDECPESHLRKDRRFFASEKNGLEDWIRAGLGGLEWSWEGEDWEGKGRRNGTGSGGKTKVVCFEPAH